MTQPKYLGQRFGMLVAVRYLGCIGTAPTYEVHCDCGKTITMYTGNMVKAQSCGCQRGIAIRKYGESITTRTNSEYQSWKNMIQRCKNPNMPRYSDYGGRGITVCDRWLDFANFLADMGPRSPDTSLDRIDPDGDYELNNCRWADPATQTSNRRPKVVCGI